MTAWVSQHWLAVVLFVLYSGALFYNAWLGRRRTRGVADYFVGGRGMGGVAIGISFYATFASTNSYIGHAGKGYAYGAPWLLMAGFLVVFAYLSWLFVAPKLRRFTADWESVTLPDFFAMRFGSRYVRIAAAAVIVFASLLYLIAIFKGGGNLLEVFLGVPYVAALGVTLVIVMIYTSVGGFVSVVRTDVIQGLLMVVGAVLIFTFVTRAAGGVDVVFTAPETQSLFAWDAGTPFAVLLGIALAGSLKLLVDPRQLSRFYALKDEAGVRRGLWVALGGIVVIQLCLFPVGIYAHLILDGVTDTDLIVPTLVNDAQVFPPLVGDFLIVAILAAAMSSLDSVLLVAASVVTRDIIAELGTVSAARQVQLTRWGVVGFAVLAAAIAIKPPGGIVEITIFSGSLYAACFLPLILFGLHWQRGNAAAALGCVGIGVVVLVVWLLAGFDSFLHEVFPAMLASTAVYLSLSWWLPATGRFTSTTSPPPSRSAN
jgi:SSS family transporter